jgi:hypothetical protein
MWANVLLLAAIGVAPAPVEQTPRHVEATCGWIDFGRYQPRNLKSLGKLPPAAGTTLAEHLAQRLGEALYSRLRFVGGQVIEFERFKAADPELATRWPNPPAFVVIFRLEGIARGDFQACIRLDARGGVASEVSLPAAADRPERASIVSRSGALQVARTNGVPVQRASARLAYFPDVDALEWLVSYAEDPKAEGGRGRTCHVPAHDPTAVHWSEYTFVY